jgi:hypothetical protein
MELVNYVSVVVGPEALSWNLSADVSFCLYSEIRNRDVIYATMVSFQILNHSTLILLVKN